MLVQRVCDYLEVAIVYIPPTMDMNKQHTASFLRSKRSRTHHDDMSFSFSGLATPSQFQICQPNITTTADVLLKQFRTSHPPMHSSTHGDDDLGSLLDVLDWVDISLCVVVLGYSPRILHVMLTLKRARMVMTMRKTAVMRSSTVRTQAGADGISCVVEDVELLSLVMLLEAGFWGAGKAGGDRDISSGLDRCVRESMVARVSRRWVGI